MLGEPKLTIKNFAGMGDGGTFYLRGLKPIMKGQERVLTPDMYSSLIISEDTTLFSGLDDAIQSYTPAGLTATYTLPYICGITTGKIFGWHLTSNNYLGLMHTVATTGDLLACLYPGVLSSINENLLYTSASYLGIGYKLKISSANATSLTVTGTDFTALGISASAGSNKVFNVTQKKEYTVTAVSGAGNITLEFASQSPAPAANDYIMVFKDDFKLLENGASTQDQHFAGQEAPSSWHRTLLLFGSSYYILNGNYIATLATDESTFSATTKQLPYKTQAMCFDINTDRMLIGGRYNNSGKIMLWDGYSDGFINIIETAVPPSNIRPYKSGWAVVLGYEVYYTDGYSLEFLFALPDSNPYDTVYSNNSSLAVCKDDIYLVSTITNLTERGYGGLWKWNAKTGLQHTPISNGSGESYICHSVGVISDSTGANIYTSTYDTIATKRYFIGTINNLSAYKTSAKFYINLPQKINISLIEVNLKTSSWGQVALIPATIYVNYGQIKNVPYQTFQGNAANTVTSLLNTSYNVAIPQIGQKIVVMNGDGADDFTFITDIDDQGTASETLTVSPALSTAPVSDSYEIRAEDLYSAGSKSIEAHNMKDDLIFNVPTFYSDKFLLEIIIDAGEGNAQFDICSINIY